MLRRSNITVLACAAPMAMIAPIAPIGAAVPAPIHGSGIASSGIINAPRPIQSMRIIDAAIIAPSPGIGTLASEPIAIT